ncbi:MAG: S-adenosylmethionine decarboxylase [Candidatus Micrarchaeia archaeon]
MDIKYWGTSTHLDICGCDITRVENKKVIIEYIAQLCKIIKMKKFGKTIIKYFGKKQGYCGYTAIQLIETSSICCHFGISKNGNIGYGYIDLFSCKEYDFEKMKRFSINYFGAKKSRMKILKRK